MNAAPAPHDIPDRDLAERLTASLHDHLDPVGAATDLAPVAVARSHRIRRNRRVATAAAVALAVVVVSAPFAWSGLRGGTEAPFVPASTSNPEPTPPTSTTTSSSSASTSASPTAGTPSPTGDAATERPGTRSATSVVTADNGRPPLRTVTLTRALPSGPAPDTAWTLDRTLHSASGTATLDVGADWTYTELAGGSGLLVDTTWDQGGSVQVVRADGSALATVVDVPAQHVPHVRANTTGTRFTVYVNAPGSTRADALLSTFDASGRLIASKSNLRHDVELAGIVGDRVFLSNENVGRSYVWDLTTNVIDRYTESGLIRAVDEANERAAVWTHNADFTRGCTEVVDVAGAPVTLARSCGTFLPQAFSADGVHLVGIPIDTDGFAAAVTDVLDVANGRISLRVAGAAFPYTDFLRDGTLGLEVVDRYGSSGTTNALVTCTVGGTCHRFTDPVAMTEDTTRYRLAR
jgi:hypothetical protein